MLQAVEVLPSARRALRRAVHVECDVVSRWWDEPVPHLARDLSPGGVWIETPFPLEVGEELVLAFSPPRLRPRREITCFGQVRRVELRRRASDPATSGMGIEFLDLSAEDAAELGAALRGLPPPLPRPERPRPIRRELVWVDTLLTWEEDLGDRLNIFEVSEEVGMVADDELCIEALDTLVTGGAPAYRWRIAS